MDMEYVEIPLSEIHADDEFNCRGNIDTISVTDLARDIERQGLISPLVVTPYDEQTAKELGMKYLLVAGYRRRLACMVNKMTKVPCIIKSNMDADDARIMNLSENIQRENLTILQEAKAISKLKLLEVSEVATAERLGMSRGWVQIRFMLLSLPEDIQLEAEAGILSQQHIRDLYKIKGRSSDPKDLYEAVRQIKDQKSKGRKKVTVDPDKNSPTAKRHRSRGEIFKMLDVVFECGLGGGIHTVCMSWCAGEISDLDFYYELEQHCKKVEKPFRRPAV